jgi:hypothetical protein
LIRALREAGHASEASAWLPRAIANRMRRPQGDPLQLQIANQDRYENFRGLWENLMQ